MSLRDTLERWLLKLLVRRMMQPRDWLAPQLGGLPREHRFVAFVDLLGFSHSVITDLDEAIATYDHLFDEIRHIGRGAFPTLEIVVASDSVIFTSVHLAEVLSACQTMQFIALAADTLVRGGIAYDLHIQRTEERNLYVVSPALVKAVRLERAVLHPCIALHSSVQIPGFAYPQPGQSNFERLLLYFDAMWVVNPFNIMWGSSAMTHVSQLLERFPQHRAKYQWFLSLYEAVRSGHPLVPDNAA